MSSQIEIANLALSLLGEPAIASFSDNSRAAREANLWFHPTRRSFLQKHPWSRAKARAQLAQLATAPAFGFSNAFALPSDYLRLVSINGVLVWEQRNASDPAIYRIEGNTLLTDDSSAKIVYIYDLEDTTKFSPVMVEAFAAHLALNLALPVTKDAGRYDRMVRLAEDRLAEARSLDSQEDPPEDATAELFESAFGVYESYRPISSS